MKQSFQPKVNKPCFIKGINKKGIVKEARLSDMQTKVTYFSRETDKRITAWFDNSQLEEYKQPKKNPKNISQFEQTREFHIAFDCPAPVVPTELSDKLAMNRAAFILEEVIELLYATAGNQERFKQFFDELIDRAELTFDKQLKKPFPKSKLIGQIDAFTDILYFGNGGFVELGVVPDNIYSIVHAANMGKLFPDGKPHYNEVGKVIKPDNWEQEFAPEPKIEKEVTNQINIGSKRFK